MLFVCQPKILHKHCLLFLLGDKTAPRETENNAYAKFWGDKQRALRHVMVFSGVVNCIESIDYCMICLVVEGHNKFILFPFALKIIFTNYLK